MDLYAGTPIQAFTDGSATSATTNAGYGCLIKYRNNQPNHQFQLSGPCGTYSSNYDAERIAIEKTLDRIQDLSDGTVPPGDMVLYHTREFFTIWDQGQYFSINLE